MKIDFISKTAIKQKASKSKTFLAKEKRVLYCIIIAWQGVSVVGRKIVATLQLEISIVDRIGQRDRIPSSNALWILLSPYRIPGLEPDGYKPFLSFSEISPCPSRLLRRRMIPSSI